MFFSFGRLRFKCHWVVTFLRKIHPSQSHCAASCYHHPGSNIYQPNHQMRQFCNGGKPGHLSSRFDGNATLSYAKTNRLEFLYKKIKGNLGWAVDHLCLGVSVAAPRRKGQLQGVSPSKPHLNSMLVSYIQLEACGLTTARLHLLWRHKNVKLELKVGAIAPGSGISPLLAPPFRTVLLLWHCPQKSQPVSGCNCHRFVPTSLHDARGGTNIFAPLQLEFSHWHRQKGILRSSVDPILVVLLSWTSTGHHLNLGTSQEDGFAAFPYSCQMHTCSKIRSRW